MDFQRVDVYKRKSLYVFFKKCVVYLFFLKKCVVYYKLYQMSNFNIGGGSSDLTDGTANINVASVSISSLTPSTTLKTDLSSKIISSAIDISDVSGLQTALDATITNPYVGTLQASDFASDNVDSYDDKIPEIDGELLTKVSKTDTSDQSIVSNLTLTDDTKKITATNIETEELTTKNGVLYITGMIDQTGNQFAIEHDSVSDNKFIIDMRGESGTILQARGGLLGIDAETYDIEIQGNALYVDCPIHLNSTIFDNNNNQAYILKKESGNQSYSMGKNVFCGSGITNLVIGENVGLANDTGTENVLIGHAIANGAVTVGFGSVCIGSGAGTKLTGGSNVFIGRRCGQVNTGSSNTFVGVSAGARTTARNSITAIGSFAGDLSGSNSTHIGTSSLGVDGLSNQISLGYQATTTAANQCVIGNSSINQFLSDGFRNLDTKTGALTLAVGKTNASKVEIGKSGAITEVMGGLVVNEDINLDGNINGLTPIGGLFSQIATVQALENGGNLEKTLVGSGVGSLTVPANGFAVGDSFMLRASGKKDNSNGNTVQIRLKSGSTVLATTGTITLPSLSFAPWEFTAEFTVRAIGVAGVAVLSTGGKFVYTDTGNYKGSSFSVINNTTFDTTASNTLNVVAIQSAVPNTMDCTNLILSKIY